VSSLYESKEIGLASDQAQLTNKAIVDHTSPALCTPITPFPADPIYSEHGSDECCVTSLAIELSLLRRTRYNTLSMGK